MRMNRVFGWVEGDPIGSNKFLWDRIRQTAVAKPLSKDNTFIDKLTISAVVYRICEFGGYSCTKQPGRQETRAHHWAGALLRSDRGAGCFWT